MLVQWTVVVDDGTRPFGPGLGVDQRRPLRLAVGETTTIDISLVNPVGGVVLLESEDFLQLTGRTNCMPSRQLFTKRSTAINAQRYRIAFSADDTKAIAAQRGVFDLWSVRGDSRVSLIQLSDLLITGAALGNNYLP